VQIFLSQAGKVVFEMVVNNNAEIDKLIGSGVVSSIRHGGYAVMRVRSRQAKDFRLISLVVAPLNNQAMSNI
jgi:hypothetical protein